MSDAFGAVLARDEIHFQPVRGEAVGGTGPDGAQPDAVERAQVVRGGQQPCDERLDGVVAREDDPVELADARAGRVELRIVLGLDDPDRSSAPRSSRLPPLRAARRARPPDAAAV
jgi:hypothetical protein